MVVDTISSFTSTTVRDQRNQAIKEDITHMLEKIWNCEPHEPFPGNIIINLCTNSAILIVSVHNMLDLVTL